MKVIGITGTLGAGKGTVVEYLVKKKGFSHYSVREYLIGKIKESGLEVNRDTMTRIANELRASNNPAFVVQELYKKAMKKGENTIIESIRTPGEIEYLKQQGDFILLAVDADPKIRFERISQRKSYTDKVDFDTFLENEKREMSSSNPDKQNLKRCIEMADILLMNDRTIEDLYRQLEEKLNF